MIKVNLLNIENQKESFKNDDNLRGFYNPSNKTILIEKNTFEISFEGFHNASNFLFAYAVAKELGIEFASFNKFDFVHLIVLLLSLYLSKILLKFFLGMDHFPELLQLLLDLRTY